MLQNSTFSIYGEQFLSIFNTIHLLSTSSIVIDIQEHVLALNCNSYLFYSFAKILLEKGFGWW